MSKSLAKIEPTAELNRFDYFSDIEEKFITRRGKNLILGTMDWALIEEWQQMQIPLHIVLRAIDNVFDTFDKQPPGTRPIGSLSYCKHEVIAVFTEWQAAQVGKHSDDVDAAPAAGLSIAAAEQHITEAIAALNAVARPELQPAIAAAVTQLCEIRSTLTEDYEAIDARLLEVEKDLDAGILTSWDQFEIVQIENEVKSQLAPYAAAMEPDAYQNTYAITMTKRLRDRAGVPRLGLFFV
jgi:hypothetical protein